MSSATSEPVRRFVDWLLGAVERFHNEDDLLDRLWFDGRMQLTGIPGGRSPDTLDEILARLSVAGRRRGGSVLLTLPDDDVFRPALMLATLLLDHWWEQHSRGVPGRRPILYCGTGIGIRDHLRHTTVRGLGQELADALGQLDLSRTSRAKRSGSRRLAGRPALVTAYAPADPGELVRRYSPAFIAIDLGSDADAGWLQPLLDEAHRREVPVVAWSRHPLSVGFMQRSWSLAVAMPCIQATPSEHFLTTRFQPIVMAGETASEVAGHLREATGSLVRAAATVGGSAGELSRGLVADAMRLHWSLVRAIEHVPCPVEHYDAHAREHWGIRSFRELTDGCERFRTACAPVYPDAATALAEVAAHTEAALQIIRVRNPLWELLAFLAIEHAEPRLRIAFMTEARRSLFLDAMLVTYGITEADLLGVGVTVAGPRDIDLSIQADDTNSDVAPTLIAGSLTDFDAARLLPLLSQESLQVAVYPHQVGALEARIGRWEQATRFEPTVLGRLGLDLLPDPPPTPPRITTEPLKLLVLPSEPVTPATPARLWEDPDPAAELESFYQHARAVDLLDADESEGLVIEHELDDERERELFCTEAIAASFSDGWHAVYAPEELLMFVRRIGPQVRTDLRRAAELRVDAEIVAIHGQRRQSLYELLVARLHQNPAIALQLALVRQWQRELAESFRSWSGEGPHTVDELLRRLQELGSTLTSPLTIRLWLMGRTLAPLNPEDLRRIAELLSMDFTTRHHRRIFAAASRLRGLHRGLSTRINNWLEREAAGEHQEDDMPIDPEAGISFEDFKSTLVYLRVTAVEAQQGLFLTSRLGLLERDTQWPT